MQNARSTFIGAPSVPPVAEEPAPAVAPAQPGFVKAMRDSAPDELTRKMRAREAAERARIAAEEEQARIEQEARDAQRRLLEEEQMRLQAEEEARARAAAVRCFPHIHWSFLFNRLFV